MDTGCKGKVVVVTGASGGIGMAVARKFAEEGARLVLQYRSGRGRAEELQRELGKGVETLVVRADLTQEREARELFVQARRRFRRVDVLVANAGSWAAEDRPLHQMSLQRWRAIQDAVLTSAFLSLREFLKMVARQKTGNAVLIGSTAGIFGEAGHAEYASAKSALVYGLTRSVKNEMARLAPHTADYPGGRINCVCPGWTVVPRTARQLRDRSMVRKVTATMALKQIARPDDIAHAVLFLASDVLARHVTGQILTIAGGMEGRLLWNPEEIDPALA